MGNFYSSNLNRIVYYLSWGADDRKVDRRLDEAEQSEHPDDLAWGSTPTAGGG